MDLQSLAARAFGRWKRLIDPHGFERAIVKRRYLHRFKRLPDLDHPRLFSEKLIWLNLHYKNPLLRTLVDKYNCRAYVEKKLGSAQLLPPLLNVYDHAGDIDFSALPNQFVLKVTGGCGWNVFCLDKSSLDFDRTRQQLTGWMNDNYFNTYREWPYRNLRSRIIAEPFMTEADHPDRSPPDYKFWCFNGRPRFVSICSDRRGDRRMDLHDCDTFDSLPFNFAAGKRRDEPYTRPADFGTMLSVCRTLAEGLPFVRVDLYPFQGKIVFGEMTLFPFAGYVPLSPKIDALIGDWLALPTDHLVAIGHRKPTAEYAQIPPQRAATI